MVNDNQFKPTNKQFKEPNFPKIETRIILNDWEQSIKKSPLSAPARSKVIQCYGSNYLSERAIINNPSYGPMPNEEGCKQKAGYQIHFSLTGEYSFKQSGATFTSCKISGKVKDIDNVRDWLKKLENGEITIVKGKDSNRDSECIKYEDYFKADLKCEISEIEKMEEYGLSR